MTTTETERLEITPRLRGSGERITIPVSQEDYRKVRRGSSWRATVTDLDTGRQYVLRGASCGSPNCFCDAIAMPVKSAK